MNKNGIIKIVLFFIVCNVISAYSTDEIQTSNKEVSEKVSGINQFIEVTSKIAQKSANAYKNYYPNTSRAAINEDSLDVYAQEIATKTEDFLAKNFITTDSIDKEYKIQTLSLLGLILIEEAEYENHPTTRSIGGCAAYAFGIKELVKGGFTSRTGLKIALKAVGKSIAKRAIPYIGWGITLGEFSYCMYHRGDV